MRRLRGITAVTVGVLLASAGVAGGNVFPNSDGQDPRVLEPRINWSPVAHVYTHVDRRTGGLLGGPHGEPGTGFMISPCHLLTNYHVVFGAVPGRGATKGAKLTATLGTPARDYQGEIVAAGDLAVGNLSPGDKLAALGQGDWALVRLSGCPGKAKDIGWLPLARTPRWEPANKVVTAAFAKDRSFPQISVEYDCSIRARIGASGALLHDCSSGNGHSGSPLMTWDQEGRPLVFAMVSGDMDPMDSIVAYKDDHSNASYAVALEDIVTHPMVRRAVREADRAASRNPFTGRSRLRPPRA